MNYIYLLSFIFTIIILFINSIQDIKTREVPFKNQIVLYFVSFPMAYLNSSLGFYLLLYFVLIGTLWYFGMGGADAKTLLILGAVFSPGKIVLFLIGFIIFTVATMVIMWSKKVPGIPAISLSFLVVMLL